MKPIKAKTRQAWNGGPRVKRSSYDGDMVDMKDLTKSLEDFDDIDDDISDLSDDVYDENGDFGDLDKYNTYERTAESTMSDEEVKVEALKQAVNMAKLFTNVTVGDVLNMASTLATYFKNYKLGQK